jgi:hypothetical protein
VEPASVTSKAYEERDLASDLKAIAELRGDEVVKRLEAETDGRPRTS